MQVDHSESDIGRSARSGLAQHAAYDHSNEARRNFARGSLGNNEGLGAGEERVHVEQDGGTAAVVAVWSDKFRTWRLASCSMIAWKGPQNTSTMPVGSEVPLQQWKVEVGVRELLVVIRARCLEPVQKRHHQRGLWERFKASAIRKGRWWARCSSFGGINLDCPTLFVLIIMSCRSSTVMRPMLRVLRGIRGGQRERLAPLVVPVPLISHDLTQGPENKVAKRGQGQCLEPSLN